MSLDIYLEFLYKKLPGGKILEVARRDYRKCLGMAQATMSYDKAALACHTRRLTFLRTNLFGCQRSRKPEKCRELVEEEIERIKGRIQLHRDRLAGLQ